MQVMAGGKDRLRRFLDDAVPFAAIVALPLPPAGNGAALLTDELALCFCHGSRISEHMRNTISLCIFRWQPGTPWRIVSQLRPFASRSEGGSAGKEGVRQCRMW